MPRQVTYVPMGGEIPVFDRPDLRSALRVWVPGNRRRPHSWTRLLLDGEGLASTFDLDGEWLKAPNKRFIVNMQEVHVSEFAHSLYEIASRGPSKGIITVFYRGFDRSPQWFVFGLAHTYKNHEMGVPPGTDLAAWCPVSV